jgi:hypothetical protein
VGGIGIYGCVWGVTAIQHHHLRNQKRGEISEKNKKRKEKGEKEREKNQT